MKQLPFISELTEARMFYSSSDLKGKKAEDIASLIYLCMVMLQILRHTNSNVAKNYAADTSRYKPYDATHFAATDLSNLFAIINHQSDHSEKIKVNANINIPLFAINRYMDDVRSGKINEHDDATFFYRLEDYLKLYSNSTFRQIRREIGQWSKLAYSDRQRLIAMVRREFDSKASSLDLYLWFKQNFKMNESIELSELSTGIEYHNELNPALWDGDVLREDVKAALQKIALRFVKFIDVEQLNIVDVIITGSNCAFNYSEFSDIDLHIIVDSSDLGDNPLTQPFLIAKKSLWNSGHDITIHGFDVELYAEDLRNDADKLVATGIYSLGKEEWLKKPSYEKVTIDDLAVQAKAQFILAQIDDIIETQGTDVDDIDRLWDHLKKMRKAGLSTGGEFSVENLAFKAVRNNGGLERLSKYQRDAEDNDLTLEHLDEVRSTTELEDLNFSNIPGTESAGEIDGATVFQHTVGSETVYFLSENTYAIISNNPVDGYFQLHRVCNKIKSKGLLTALIMFIVVRLGKNCSFPIPSR